MAGDSKTTQDHEEIKRWAEVRGGKPAVVRDTEGQGQGTGVLRINFPGYSGDNSLEEISWNEWFKTFDEKNLAFLYQEETSDGQQSRFFKLINE
jgi:hypothetical protein